MERSPSVFFVCAIILVLSLPSQSDGQSLDPRQIISGTFGRPVAVKNEADKWSTPILVYADPDVEIFIPDITSPGWLAWHVEFYRETGQYSVPLFEYYKNDHLCLKGFPPSARNDAQHIAACREIAYDKREIIVDTRNQTVTLGPLFLMRSDAIFNPLNEVGKTQTLPLSGIGPRTAKALSRVSVIVADGSQSYAGLPAREALEHDLEIQRKMAMNAFGHDCAPYSDKEAWKNWHNTGCPPKTVSPTASASNKPGPDRIEGSQEELMERSGGHEVGPVFRAGGDVSAPHPIFTPDAEYSNEARVRKVQGTCGLSAVVGADGRTQDVRVTHPLGSGLDEKAVEAVKTWRFEPGRKGGEPVAVRMDVNMTFRLFVSPSN